MGSVMLRDCTHGEGHSPGFPYLVADGLQGADHSVTPSLILFARDVVATMAFLS